MKRVTTSKRRIGIKILMSWSLILFSHLASFAAYIFIFLIINYYLIGGPFWPVSTGSNIWIFYTLLLAPIINSSLHVTYDEIGSPWTRFAMWVHSFFHMLFIPLAIFVLL